MLIQSGLHKVLKGRNCNMVEEKCEKLDLKAASAIRLCLDKNVIANMQRMSTAKELWRDLKAYYIRQRAQIDCC